MHIFARPLSLQGIRFMRLFVLQNILLIETAH